MPVNLKRLRQLIEEQGRTQADVASAAGMMQPGLSRILRGNHPNVPIDTLDRLAKALGVKTKDLIL